MVTMAPLTRVLVRTNSLLDALQTTSIIRTFRLMASVAHEKNSLVQSESAELFVVTSGADHVDTLGHQFSHRRGATFFVGTLLSDLGPFTSSSATFVESLLRYPSRTVRQSKSDSKMG